MQAGNWLPWQSVRVTSKGCLKTLAFRSNDGKQHLPFLALELGDRGNNRYCTDRELFEFSPLPLCTWSNSRQLKGWCTVGLPAWYERDKNCCSWNIWEHKAQKKNPRSQGGKARQHKKSPKLGPCRSGLHRLQRKSKGRRENGFSPNMPWMGCTGALKKTHFHPHLFFNIILSLYTSTSVPCTLLLLTTPSQSGILLSYLLLWDP